MTRRELFALPSAVALAGPRARSQTFSGIAYRDYSRCLPDYLRTLARQAHERRNVELARLTTPEAVRQRQAWARETFWKLIGGMPERTPLGERTLGSFARAGYKVEKVLYESRPKFHIPANLYIPTSGKAPFPGVLFQMGHSLNGKAYDSYQRCCQALARLGFLVLAFDPMGQGERVYYPTPDLKRTRLSSADEEHTLPGKQMLLLGDSSTRMQVWDAVRSMDYLSAHPLVDRKRIGATGQSGGGTLTMLLAAVDDRLAAAVVCSGNTENVACANFNPPGSTDDAEQDFVDSGPAAFDRWDVLCPFAPKPLLITVSDKDFFGTYSSNYISSGREEFQKLRKVYEVLGQRDHLAWGDTLLPHGLSYDTRLQVYNWFARHLQNKTAPITEEPPVEPEPDATLWVSASGNVVHSFGGETPFSLNKSRVVVKKPMPLDRLLRADRPAPDLRPVVLGRVPSRGIHIQALEVRSGLNVWLPAWLYVPGAPDASKPLVLAIEPGGRNVRWHETETYQKMAVEGYTVCVPDLRGVGDLAPEFGRGNPRYARPHQDEENYAWASLILGRPLVGQRVTDVLAMAAALRRHPALAGRRLRLTASGKMCVAAMCAAALDPKIDEIELTGGLISYRSIVDTEEYGVAFADFAPGLLLHTDLPEVAAAIAPRALRLRGMVNAAGEKVEVSEVRRLYPHAQLT